MSSTVRLTSLLGFLVLSLTACGGSSPGECDSCASQEMEARCGPTSGCDPTDPTEPEPKPTFTLRLRLRNVSSTPHECSKVDVAKVTTSGSLVITTVAPGGVVDNGGEIVGSISFPSGTQLSGNGGCWRVGDPSAEDVYGSFPILLDANKDCVMIYNDNGYPGDYASMRMECVTF